MAQPNDFGSEITCGQTVGLRSEAAYRGGELSASGGSVILSDRYRAALGNACHMSPPSSGLRGRKKPRWRRSRIATPAIQATAPREAIAMA